MAYRILFTPRAFRDLEALPDRDRERIAKRIDGLAKEPRPSGVQKLEGSDDVYGMRVGDYRVLYTILDRVVTVSIVRVAHRRDIYR
jgi:mRNA interferase RelE/StbE